MNRVGRCSTALVAALLVAVPATGEDLLAGEEPSPPGPAVDSSAEPTAIEVSGVLEHVVVDRGDTEETVYLLRADDGRWRLDGVDESAVPVPPSQSTVTVEGVRQGENVLEVRDLTVELTPHASTLAAPAATKTLGIRVFWGAQPPSKPTTAEFRKKVIADSAAWFKEVSGGRYRVSGAVTGWLRIPQPRDCFGSFPQVGSQAVEAAGRAGYPVGSFTRYIIYMPCSAGGIAGVATIYGSEVWLFQTLAKGVVMHEQGHNLGLEHASSKECRGSKGWPSVTWGRRCDVNEYGDRIDAMGNRESGHYNSYFKQLLGWLGKSTTVSTSRTVTLSPYSGPGTGLRAARVKSGGKVFWLEYRARRAADSGLTKGTDGVEIRFQAPGRRTHLLDAAPGSTKGYFDFADVALPVGSSWTTPEKVRITVVSRTASAAKVQFRYGAPARRPGRPGIVKAIPVVKGVKLSWGRPGDNGSIIGWYEVKNLTTGQTRKVTSAGGTKTETKWGGLKPGKAYRFAVRAVNVLGKSDVRQSPPVRPRTDTPSIRIDKPRAGATVKGLVTVEYTVAPNPVTKSRISSVDLLVDGRYVDGDYQAPFGPLEWSSLGERDGSHTLKVIVTDRRFKTASATRKITVANPVPVVLTSPKPKAVLRTATKVGYTLLPPRSQWTGVELRVNGSWADSAAPGGRLEFRPVEWGPGTYNLRVVGYHNASGKQFQSDKVPVRVPTPTVAIDSPSNGAVIATTVPVTYTLSSWDWDYVELYVDGVYTGFAWAGDPLEFDPSSHAPGNRTLVVKAYDTWGSSYDSSPRNVEV